MAQCTSGQSVLLGFKDAPLECHTSSSDISKIGGLPDVPSQVMLTFPSCPLCSAALCLVTQLYCPLEASVFHRVIHVFACCRKPCWGKHESWVALRSQSTEVSAPASGEGASFLQENLAATDWCDDADNWGVDDNPVEKCPVPTTVSNSKHCPVMPQEADCTSQLQNLSLSERLGKKHHEDSVFCSHYIAVADEEECASDLDLKHAQHLLREYEKREGLPQEEQESCTGKGESEKYEKHNLRSQDIVFYKFMKKIASCRQQIIRYSWNGTPLFISPTEYGFKPPPCTRCGGRRVFEFQLMPALVSMLQSVNPDIQHPPIPGWNIVTGGRLTLMQDPGSRR
ncbi:programmed cell death 2-like [Pelobates cultripes]|uniref:Programmed cell death 2-like n=1 Tax=Pelobates cultripes TaxID=61616 RepID=A0AAD1TD21_PELCU|nr:programmed cell death 2-like [Pelobates cultripes]